MKGKKKTEEHRLKLVEASKGNSYHKGHKHSDESKQKMKDAWILRKKKKDH